MKKVMIKTAKALWNVFPMVLGTVLLISLITSLVPKSFYISFFGKNSLLDSFFGSLVGSISAGNPITSYIFGGEMLNQGVGLVAVTAFLVSWVTVGLVQFPAEATILGKKFALVRNVSSFFLSILVAIITVFIFKLF